MEARDASAGGSSPAYRCQRCGADWTAGAHTPGCPQCGGGAMEIDCPICGGRCGRRWRRSVLDSWDFDLGHWHGECALPRAEQLALMQAATARPQAAVAAAHAPPPPRPPAARDAGRRGLLARLKALFAHVR